jgi:hypothetical protein
LASDIQQWNEVGDLVYKALAKDSSVKLEVKLPLKNVELKCDEVRETTDASR